MAKHPGWLLCAVALTAASLAGCATGTAAAPTTSTKVVFVTPATTAVPSATATATQSSPVATATQPAAPAPTPTQQPSPQFDFPSDARASCMTADYGSRIPITDPGLRTEAGHKTTCGFAERVASVLRAAAHTHPDQGTYSLSVYSSILDENRPVSCTVSAGIATCTVDSGSEHIYVTTRDTSG